MTLDEKKIYLKEYREKNKEKIVEYCKKYREENKEQLEEKRKEYRKTPAGIKNKTISNWKEKGIKSDNYDTLYDNYLAETHCDLCRVKFGKKGDGSGTWKCADHDHASGEFRNFLCNRCNLKRG